MFSPYERARSADGFGGWFDAVKSGLASVVPSHTIVGKWASGDNSGAAADAAKWGASQLNPPKAQTVKITPGGATGGFSIPGLGNVSPTMLALGLVGGLAAYMVYKRRR